MPIAPAIDELASEATNKEGALIRRGQGIERIEPIHTDEGREDVLDQILCLMGGATACDG
jgi:hypothetical protein